MMELRAMHTFLLAMPVCSDIKVNMVYERLPLHCTLVQAFQAYVSRHDIFCSLCKSINAHKQFEIVSDEPAKFGPNNDVPVFTIKENEQLRKLHATALKVLSSHHVEYVEPKWVNGGYRPHVTTVGKKAFKTDNTCLITSVCLVEYVPLARDRSDERLGFPKPQAYGNLVTASIPLRPH